jgi:hypothetical protein
MFRQFKEKDKKLLRLKLKSALKIEQKATLNQVSDYRLLGASGLFFSLRDIQLYH